MNEDKWGECTWHVVDFFSKGRYVLDSTVGPESHHTSVIPVALPEECGQFSLPYSTECNTIHGKSRCFNAKYFSVFIFMPDLAWY